MTKWKMNKKPVPQHVVQMLVIDEHDRVLVMHRSDKVRSAKNVWSIPSGMHDIGETVAETAVRELKEEFDLDAKPGWLPPILQYENIAGDAAAEEQYHWVIDVYLVHVDDVTKATNKEPEKHDEMKFVPLDLILHDAGWKDAHTFHESLDVVLVPALRKFFLGR